MDWSKAKNYIIFFLICLNIFLFICNVKVNRKYILDDNISSSVEKLLENNGIKLKSELPKNYYPMRQMNLEGYIYDYIQLQDIFFNSGSFVTKTREFEKTIISSEQESITIYNNIVYYKNLNNNNFSSFEKDVIIEKCNEYANRISNAYSEMIFDSIYETDNSFIVDYFVKYNEYNIFSNYLRFIAKDDGTFYAEFKYGGIGEMYGMETDICSPDEAIFVFMDEIKKIIDADDICIEKIEIGYYSYDYSDNSSENYNSSEYNTAVPCYRIVEGNTNRSFFINAYNRRLIL